MLVLPLVLASPLPSQERGRGRPGGYMLETLKEYKELLALVSLPRRPEKVLDDMPGDSAADLVAVAH